jgi:SAM-dependent methyltransferase
MHIEEFREMQAIEEHHFWFAGKRLLLNMLLERAGGHPERVLDIGCGTGGLLKTLAGRASVFGVDYEELALRFCRDKGLDAVVRGSGLELPFAAASFDVCVMFDVLEHVDDELALLRELRRVLPPGGAAIVSVPAFQALWSQHDETFQHRRRYRRRELVERMEAAGFEIDWCTYTNVVIFVPALVWRVLRRATGLAAGMRTDFVMPPAPINRLLVETYRCEASLLKRLRAPFGVSVACVARVPAASS